MNRLGAQYACREYLCTWDLGLYANARCSTVAYDDLAPPGQDERWEIFGTLHAYLEQRFPLVCVSTKSFV